MRIFKKIVYALLFTAGLFLSAGAGLVLFKSTPVPFGSIFNPSFYTFVGSMLFVLLLIAFSCHKTSKRWIEVVGIASRILFLIIVVITEHILQSFKKKDNKWTERLDLGKEIDPGRSFGKARVTPDGKYIFFVNEDEDRRGIYWVSSKVIDSFGYKLEKKKSTLPGS